MIVLSDEEDEVEEIEGDEKMGTLHTTGRASSASRCKESQLNSDDTNDVCVVNEVSRYRFANNPRGAVLKYGRLNDPHGIHVGNLKRWKRQENDIASYSKVRRNMSALHGVKTSAPRTNIFGHYPVVRLEEKNKYQELIQAIIGFGMVYSAQMLKKWIQKFQQSSQTQATQHSLLHFQPAQIQQTLPAPLPPSRSPRKPPPVMECVDLTSDSDNEVVEVSQETESSEAVAEDRPVDSDDGVIELDPEPETSLSLPQTSSQQRRDSVEFVSSASSSQSEEPPNAEEIQDTCITLDDENPDCVSDMLRSSQMNSNSNLEEQIEQQMIINDVGRHKSNIVHNEDDLEEALPEITFEMQDLVRKAFASNPSKVLVEAFNITIRTRDIFTLKGSNWLNDEVINFYMSLLMERGKLGSYPSVYCFNTFFYVKLVTSGHASLKRWTQKVDIFSYDLLIVPVHLKVHWCLACINVIQKRIEYYDSMGGKNDQCGEALLTYLEDEYLDKKKEKFNRSEWNKINMQDIPEQLNGCDCGVFACMYAEHICRLAKLGFTQRAMPYFRVKMVYEILTKKLLL